MTLEKASQVPPSRVRAPVHPLMISIICPIVHLTAHLIQESEQVADRACSLNCFRAARFIIIYQRKVVLWGGVGFWSVWIACLRHAAFPLRWGGILVLVALGGSTEIDPARVWGFRDLNRRKPFLPA